MAFSKAVLLVIFAVLLISAEVSSHRDLAETTTTPTTDQDGHGINRDVIGGNTGNGGSVSCNRGSKVPCKSSGRNGVQKCNNPNKRECYRGGNGGKGGKGGNGGKGGRGGYGPETEN